ncbi:hypothetical protein F5Y18DRAFT_431487 [Xylariaceae sp. FL1019]|nr:hypothetical protein F5Y18DRAFT_431487 [Xylariaceae sp. FL1019]
MSLQRANTNTTDIPQNAGREWVLLFCARRFPIFFRSSAPSPTNRTVRSEPWPPAAPSSSSTESRADEEDEGVSGDEDVDEGVSVSVDFGSSYVSFPEFRETRRGFGVRVERLRRFLMGRRVCRCDFCQGAGIRVTGGEVEGGVEVENEEVLGPYSVRRLERVAELIDAPPAYVRLGSESGSIAEDIEDAMSTPLLSSHDHENHDDVWRLSASSMEVPIMLDWQTLGEHRPPYDELVRRQAVLALGPDHPFLQNGSGSATPIERRGEFPRMRGEPDPASVPSPPVTVSRRRGYFDRVFSRGDVGEPESLGVEAEMPVDVVRPMPRRVETLRRPSIARRVSGAVLGRGSGFGRRPSCGTVRVR